MSEMMPARNSLEILESSKTGAMTSSNSNPRTGRQIFAAFETLASRRVGLAVPGPWLVLLTKLIPDKLPPPGWMILRNLHTKGV
jgi:hypothetical protein